MQAESANPRIFTPERLSFWEGLDPKTKWHLEGSGPTMVLYHLGTKVKPEAYSAFVEEATGIATGFLGQV